MKIVRSLFASIICLSAMQLSAQSCVGPLNNISDYKVYKESFSTGSTTEVLPSGIKLDANGHLCLTGAEMLDAPRLFTTNVDVTQGNISSRRQAMAFYHLAGSRAFAQNDLPGNLASALDNQFKFTVEDIGEPLFMVDESSNIVTVDYRKRVICLRMQMGS